MKNEEFTPDPWDLPKDISTIDAAELFVRRYEIQKVNDDIFLSGKDYIKEGFRAGVAWQRRRSAYIHVNGPIARNGNEP